MTGSASVIIPTRDRPEELCRCLQAVLGGTIRPRDVVVVDQGSRRADREARAAFEDAEVELRYVAAPEGGVSRARNVGVAAASCDLVAFTDDDCVPSADWLSQLTQALSPRTAGATGRVLPLPAARPGLVPKSSRTRTEPRVHRRGSAPWEAGTGGNLCLRRGVIESLGGFDERFGPGAPFKAAEDVELLQRALGRGHLIAYVPEAVVYHQMHSPRARLASRFPYGFGMGALAASRLGQSGESRRLAGQYASLQASMVAHGIATRSPSAALEPLIVMLGFAAGFVAYVAPSSRSAARSR